MKYEIVITNPPYMGNNSMNKNLVEYLKLHYPKNKNDMFAVFMEKGFDLARNNGFISMITMQSWMFLASFEDLRRKILQKNIINLVQIGFNSFPELNSKFALASLFVFRNINLKNFVGTYLDLNNKYSHSFNKEKAFFNEIKNNEMYYTKINNFNKIPGSPIAYWIPENVFNLFGLNKMKNFAFAKAGIVSGNDDFFLKAWYEIDISNISFDSNKFDIEKIPKWVPINKGGYYRKFYGNNSFVINLKSLYDNNKTSKSVRRGDMEYYFKESLTWSMITIKSSYRYSINKVSGVAAPSLFIFDKKFTKYLLGFLNSNVSEFLTKILNPTLNLLTGDILNLPIIISEKQIDKVNYIVDNNISILKQDWDSYETSYNFEAHILFKEIMNYSIEKTFNKVKFNQEQSIQSYKSNLEKLNKIFTCLYKMENCVTNITSENHIELKSKDIVLEIKSFILYAVGCMFGRYSLNETGLIFAGGDWDYSRYSKFLPDEDNIIPITDTEYFDDDIVGRFVEFVKVTFGDVSLEENLDFIAKALKNKGNTSRETIRNYFLNDFYKDHIKTYKKRPIYWLFDSGNENGFKALIYIHRYEPDLAARVRTDYLHKTQKALETAIASNERILENSTSASEKAKAVKAKNMLVKQLEETRKYDSALAHVANQRIAIDLDDGVKVNYEKFQGVKVSSEGKKDTKIDLLKKI